MVFDRIAELYLLAQANMTEQLAYRQAANGLDFIVFVGSVDETQIGGHRHRFVSHVLEVTGIGEGGRPATNTIFSPAARSGRAAGGAVDAPAVHQRPAPGRLRLLSAATRPAARGPALLPLMVQGRLP